MQIPPRREGDAVVISRAVPATAERVWEALTVNDQLARWYGTYTGDPAEGQVQVTMTAEEGDTPMPMRITACEPRSHLGLASDAGPYSVELDVRLEEGPDRTVVDLAHRVLPGHDMGEWGPGWEFYLDRLVAAVTGGNPAEILFEDYFPSRAGKYRDLTD